EGGGGEGGGGGGGGGGVGGGGGGGGCPREKAPRTLRGLRVALCTDATTSRAQTRKVSTLHRTGGMMVLADVFRAT
ncbi:MAG TPA: hypothetical protein VNB54_12935, partial [Alphaproteobacteria bacterium]|nr:hypothetical protein [Alphaproteobacteria bacterium]